VQGGSRGRRYGAGTSALSCAVVALLGCGAAYSLGSSTALGTLLLALIPPSALPRPVGSLVYERRESLMLGAAVCVVGIGVGLLIALLRS
jgi:hypothetical protein